VVISGWDRSRSLFPDVRVIHSKRKSTRPARRGGSIDIAEPIVIELADEPETLRYLEIREVSFDSRLVTVLEVLSPSNKRPGDGQEQYLRKVQELRDAGVNLVEIDLLREGDWVVAVPMDAIEPNVRTDYRVIVRRGSRRLRAEYYPIALSDRLPAIGVPLRASDADMPLDLQALLEQCYENVGYDDTDYNQTLESPLSPAAACWTAPLLCRASRRGGRKPRR
jgi:hypothetical protein